MNILVTNDDGIRAPGLWALVEELAKFAKVVVAAPDREQSATGTSITLRHPLRVRTETPLVPGVETYAVEGTPGDSVILALGSLVKERVDLVVSGINLGANLGCDVLISGTVGAALQGYLRGLPAIAVSVDGLDGKYLGNAARLAGLLARRIGHDIDGGIFLNVNLPNLPLEGIKGVKLTRLASRTHTDTVEEGHDGRNRYYWLVRQRRNNHAGDRTDLKAVEHSYISITPLFINWQDRPAPLPDSLGTELFRELQKTE